MEDKCYETLKNFLSNIGGKLGRIFRAKPEWHTVSGLSLNIDIRKWERELKKKNYLTKFLYMHLAPKEMKSRIKEKVFLDIDTFKSHCKNICDINEKKKERRSKQFLLLGKPQQIITS